MKWFSELKGYGFITDDGGLDHHFHVSAVRGAVLPRTGSLVTFEAQEGKRGPKALNVAPLEGDRGPLPSPGPARANIDDRVVCTGCQRHMVPRIITGPPLIHATHGWTPVPKRSICPYCGTTFRKFPASGGEKIGLVIFLVAFGAFALYVLTSLLPLKRLSL